MRAANISRVKRRLLREAVEDNLETIRGLPPRALRPVTRGLRLWARRIGGVVVPVALAASAFFVAVPTAENALTHGRSELMPILSAAPSPTQTAAPGQRVAASAFPLSVRRVIIDAGHGGIDPGATTAALLEKQITLDIGHRLRTMLERAGFEVLLTRHDDRTVALRDRAQFANGARGDIFISIHVNSLVKHTTARGIETYYLGATDDPSLTALAASENKVSGYSLADLRRILDGVYAGVRSEESSRLAQSVQDRLYRNLKASDTKLENWGVKRAPFVVLVGTEMPAILAEVGCISNEQEAAMLARPDYRQEIAVALHDGILNYAASGEPLQKKGT
jgi:N-acetylmuramoyl-L-alanine amidase